MLSDWEAAEIERKRREGVSGGPILPKWTEQLLADRKERLRQIEYLRKRLAQAAADALSGLASDACAKPRTR